MPVVTLPDGSQREFPNPVSVHDVAADIGPGLAKAALGGVVDGREVDTSFTIEADASLAIITDRDDAGTEIIRHSTAHLLAMAVQALYPGTQRRLLRLSSRNRANGAEPSSRIIIIRGKSIAAIGNLP